MNSYGLQRIVGVNMLCLYDSKMWSTVALLRTGASLRNELKTMNGAFFLPNFMAVLSPQTLEALSLVNTELPTTPSHSFPVIPPNGVVLIRCALVGVASLGFIPLRKSSQSY